MLFVSKKSILTFLIWGLFGLWGSLVGVVIAEQIEVMPTAGEEKTQASELALAGLAQALKPDVHVIPAEQASVEIVPIVFEALPSTLAQDVFRSNPCSPPDLGLPDLYQRLCTYRI